MKISQTPQPTIPALAPEKRVEAVKVRPSIGAGLQGYLKQNPSGIALGSTSTVGGVSWRQPVDSTQGDVFQRGIIVSRRIG
jgi:hypothetical protein